MQAAAIARNSILLLSLLAICVSTKIYVVSPLGQFPTNGTAASWIRSTDLGKTLSGLARGDTVNLCEGEEFVGQFLIMQSFVTVQSYPCTQNKAGIKPLITMAIAYQGSPSVDASTKRWVYDLSSYKQLFGLQPDMWALWIAGKRYYPARFPNLLDPSNPVGQSRAEFIFGVPTSLAVSRINSVEPSGGLRNLSGGYWVGATLRIRETTWGYTTRTVTAVHDGRLVMDSNFTNPSTLSGAGFFIEHNRPDELDAPGEFYFDKSAFKLYVLLMPGHQSDSRMRFFPSNASSPDAQHKGAALVIGGTKVTVRGLAVRYAYSGVMTVTKVDVTDFDVSDMLNMGVVGYVNLIRCALADIGYIAAQIYSNADVPRPLVLASSFRRVALWAGYTAQPVSLFCNAPCVVRDSIFDGALYAAAAVTSGCHLANNTIANTMLGLSDGAAIIAGTFRSGITVEGNTIAGIAGNLQSVPPGTIKITSAFTWGAGSANVTVRNNTILTGYVAPSFAQSCFNFGNGRDTLIADNVCVGGRVDMGLADGFANYSGLVIDRNVFMPTPGTRGPDIQLQLRYRSGIRSRPGPGIFRSVAGNLFCKDDPAASPAAWSPMYMGTFTPDGKFVNDLGVANYVDVSTDAKDTSGACRR